MVAFIGKTGLFRPLPMNLVRIAEQHRIVTLAEVEQKIQLIIRNIIEHGDPGGIYLFVRQRLSGQMTDTVAKLCYRNGTELDLHEQILMLVVIDNHAAKIYNQIFYAFHDLLLIDN